MRKKIFNICFALAIMFTCCMVCQVEVFAENPSEHRFISEKSVKKRNSLWNCKKEIKKTIGAFTYYACPSRNGKEAWIYQIDINAGKKHRKLKIPAKLDNMRVTCLGADYDTYGSIFGGDVSRSHDDYANPDAVGDIREIKMPDSIKVILPQAFAGMNHLKTVTIPKKVKEIGKEAFYSCPRLKKVKLSAALKKLDTTAFDNCTALISMTLPGKNKTFQIKDKCIIRKKDKALIYSYANEEILNIPEGVKTLKAFSLNTCRSRVVNIPASVTNIEGYAFCRTKSLENRFIRDVTVSKENNTFAKDGQCIYNKTDQSLSVAVVDENGVLRISEQVSYLTDTYSIINNVFAEDSMTKLILPENLKSVTAPAFIRLSKSQAIYFLGQNPPVMNIAEEYRDWVNVPGGNLYVPKDSLEIYKAWYINYGNTEISPVYWHTFDPGQEI